MKQQKKEPAAKSGRKHNPMSRGNNSRRKPTVWGQITRSIGKGKNKKEIVDTIRVPHDKMWDPELLENPNLPFPFDSLHYDWLEQLIHYGVDRGLKVKKSENPSDSTFTYGVYDKYGNALITVVSARNVMFNPRAKKYRGK